MLHDVEASCIAKGRDTSRLRRGLDLAAIVACGRAIRDRLSGGGRALTLGNGGSSTDAQDLARDLAELGWPSIALTNDVASVTAIANDVGQDKLFARQLIALARAGDVLLGFSTSGSSPNVVAALQEADTRGLLTCAVTGGDGGRLGELEWLDHLFVVGSDYIPRIQEAHATVSHLLLDVIGPR